MAFTDKDIKLLKTFADQAVIAIQNARLFNETKEALEQQKASAEVLSVISNSVSDSAPVFEAIVQSCQRLFASGNSIISLVDAEGLVRHEAIAMSRQHGGVSDDDARRFLDRGFPRPLAQSYQGYPIRKRELVHYPDMLNGPKVPEAMRQMARDVGNYSHADRTAAVGGQGHRHDPRDAHAASALHGQGVRPAAHLRRPGRDRDPERAPVQGSAGSAAPPPRPPTKPRAPSWRR